MIMEYKLEKASDFWFEEKVEINNLEDLKKLSEQHNCEKLVIDPWEMTITIYDGYLE